VNALVSYMKKMVARPREAAAAASTMAGIKAAMAAAATATQSGSIAAPTVPVSGPSDDSTATGQLLALYQAQSRLEVELRSAEAEQAATNRLVNTDLGSLTAIPDEDPLLTEARHATNAAETDLKNLRVSLAETNPEVVAARERLRIAQDHLRQVQSAVLQGRSSESVQLEALRARYAEVKNQISDAEKTFRVGRTASTDLELLRNQVALYLGVLETTASQRAVLILQTVSGQNRLTVVDRAIPPRFGKPGLAMIAAISLFLTVFVLQLWVILEYLRRWYREPVPVLTFGGANGAHG
jgi:hypothetical protein